MTKLVEDGIGTDCIVGDFPDGRETTAQAKDLVVCEVDWPWLSFRQLADDQAASPEILKLAGSVTSSCTAAPWFAERRSAAGSKRNALYASVPACDKLVRIGSNRRTTGHHLRNQVDHLSKVGDYIINICKAFAGWRKGDNNQPCSSRRTSPGKAVLDRDNRSRFNVQPRTNRKIGFRIRFSCGYIVETDRKTHVSRNAKRREIHVNDSAMRI